MTASLAYYLKYRPQTLSQVIGQETVKKTLLYSFQNNKLSHAYLFVGPRGTGKTSTARILAKMVNCTEVGSRKSEDIPCNQCPTCISITDGSNLDLIEIDAASNRGIEDIRSLREKIKLSPSSAKKKVYIIDEVHMLTAEAFNALLKTLEEPPHHALFILATTESGKIPQTILSRVQRLDFKLATPEQLSQTLKEIALSERLDIEEEALKALVKSAEGSFRDGVKLLDQISVGGKKITVKTVEENLKAGQFDSILELVQILKSKQAQAALLNVAKQIEDGADPKQLILSLMDIFRNLMLVKNEVGEQLVKPHLTEDQYQQLVKAADKFLTSGLVTTLDILQNALEKLRFASIPSLPLELAIVEICDENSEFRVQNSELKETEKPQITSQEAAEDVASNSDSDDILKLKEKWAYVCETIRPFNFSLEALLRSVKIADCTPSTVIMEVPYSFHQRILEAPKNRDLLESIFSDILGRAIIISTVLGSRSTRKEDIANIEVAADDDIIRAAAEIFNSDTVN